MNFTDILNKKTEEVEEIIYRYLPEEIGHQKEVFEAMNYSVKAGGKRLRPMLMAETYRYFAKNNSNEEALYRFMAALEYIHTYSLVHDDLPAMDNDELRRGMPTTHVKYGHALAILAGDGLLNYAFEVATGAFNEINEYMVVARALKVLSNKPGVYGMIGGQVIDVENTGKDLNIDIIETIHKLKTGALLQASMMIGAILAGESDETVDMVADIGLDIGMAFQIQDDILDVTSTDIELGKPVKSDEKNSKVTYVNLVGIEKAKELVKEYTDRAINNLESLNGDNEFLVQLLKELVSRKK